MATQAFPVTGCGRASPTITALTWLPDDTLSDVVSPLPGAARSRHPAHLCGRLRLRLRLLPSTVTSWTDGRVAIGGQSQQDAFTDRELVGFAVTTTTPACNSIINTQPTDFVINLSDAVNTATVQASDFTVNGTPANLRLPLPTAIRQITFHFNTSPVTMQGPQTMHIRGRRI